MTEIENKNEVVTPAEGEKLFTQEEVNELIRKRLTRDREKRNPGDNDLDQRARDLDAREAAITCKEYVSEMGYPADLLDIIGTSNVDDFKAKADKIMGLASANRGTPGAVRIDTGAPLGTGGPRIDLDTKIAEAFKKH
jgi:hypothetical protein